MTAYDRVKRGIKWIDKNKTICGQNWRLKIDIEALRFADPDKGPLGQLFGAYYVGLNKLRIASGGGSQLGFRTEYNIANDARELKIAWRQALYTDLKWDHHKLMSIRSILGTTYTIYKNDEDKYLMDIHPCYGGVFAGKTKYKNRDSVVRAIRKLSYG